MTPVWTLALVRRAGAAGRVSITFRAALEHMSPLQWGQVSRGQASPLPEVPGHGAGECRLVTCHW